MSTKNVTFMGKRFDIKGVGPDDPYFAGLADHSDADFANLIQNLLPKDCVALDIGANIGVTACMLSQHLSEGQIHAFEPSPSVFPILNRNVTTNNLDNVTPRQRAVGAKQGTLSFVGESAYGHLVAGSEGAADQANAVTVDTIDDIVAELGLTTLDFIKIDVEGFEDDVLTGGKAAEAKFKPLYYMEFNAFCIAAYGRMNPYDFAQRVLNDFEHVFMVTDRGSERMPKDAAHLLHTNIVNEGSVSNLLMTNDANRLTIKGDVGLDQISALRLERDQAYSAQSDLIAQRDHARRYPWKYIREALKMRRKT